MVLCFMILPPVRPNSAGRVFGLMVMVIGCVVCVCVCVCTGVDPKPIPAGQFGPEIGFLTPSVFGCSLRRAVPLL